MDYDEATEAGERVYVEAMRGVPTLPTDEARLHHVRQHTAGFFRVVLTVEDWDHVVARLGDAERVRDLILRQVPPPA